MGETTIEMAVAAFRAQFSENGSEIGLHNTSVC